MERQVGYIAIGKGERFHTKLLPPETIVHGTYLAPDGWTHHIVEHDSLPWVDETAPMNEFYLAIREEGTYFVRHGGVWM